MFRFRVRRVNGSPWAYDGDAWTWKGERALRHTAQQTHYPVAYADNVLAELKDVPRNAPQRDSLMCSTLLISESGSNSVFESISSWFSEEFSSELKRSEILRQLVL